MAASDVRDAMRYAADRLRGVSDTTMGLRSFVVQVQKTVWSGVSVGDGVATVTTLTLTPNPRVTESDDARELTVGPITPTYSINGGGGYTFDQLRPRMDGVTEFAYVVTGPFTGAGLSARTYELASIEEYMTLHYTLKLVISEVHAPSI